MSNFIVFENPEDADRYCVGREMWSPDGGKTWFEKPGHVHAETTEHGDRVPCITVVAVDVAGGVITVRGDG